MNRRYGDPEHGRDGGSSASALNGVFDWIGHEQQYAIIARDTQAHLCDKRELVAGVNSDGCVVSDRTGRAIAVQEVMDMLSLRRRIKELGLTQATVALHLGIDTTAVSKMLSGHRKLSAIEAVKLSQLLGVDELGLSAVRHIPVVGLISAGGWESEIGEPMFMMPAPDPDLPRRCFGAVVDGDSMDRVVANGATIIIDPDDLDLVERGIYAVMNGSGETCVKEFLANPARLSPMSSNPRHHVIYPGRETFIIVGRVIWKAERLR
jgi:repressor LexA